MQRYNEARNLQTQLEQRELAAKKAKLDLELQQAMQGGGILGDMNDPDKMEAVGTRLALGGHPGGAALVNAAEKIRKERAAKAAFATMKSQAGVADQQVAEEAAGLGVPAPATPGARPGIFGSLFASPYVGEEAKTLQAQLDQTPSSDPEMWLKHYERLRQIHTDREAKLAQQAPSIHVVKDAESSTGWSYRDMKTGKITSKDAPPPATSMMNNNDVIPAQHKDMHGADYLATLPTGMANLVKGVARGEVPLSAASMRYGNREALMQRVMQYDPTYNQNRPKVWTDFTSGKTATNITAMNTVIAHMGTVNKLTDALQNGDIQTVNRVVNAASTEFGRPEINNAELAIQAMGNELMRVFRQVNASQAEVEAWEKKFNAAKGSPEQLKGALRTGAELLKGRVDAVNDQWKRGMNTEEDFPNILSPKSRQALKGLGVSMGDEKTPPSSGQIDDLLKKYGKPR